MMQRTIINYPEKDIYDIVDIDVRHPVRVNTQFAIDSMIMHGIQAEDDSEFDNPDP